MMYDRDKIDHRPKKGDRLQLHTSLVISHSNEGVGHQALGSVRCVREREGGGGRLRGQNDSFKVREKEYIHT